MRAEKLHDSNLHLIRFNDSDKIHIEAISEDQLTLVKCEFYSVKRFRCDRLLEGNIIFGIDRVTEKEAVRCGANALLGHLSGVDALGVEIDNVERDVQAGVVQLFHVSSSYGAEVWVLCAGINISTMPLP
jgi:hypothetical protein